LRTVLCCIRVSSFRESYRIISRYAAGHSRNRSERRRRDELDCDVPIDRSSWRHPGQPMRWARMLLGCELSEPQPKNVYPRDHFDGSV